jgi:mannose-6-phosphate isomerase-like protein (cupin superfamily)
MSLSKVNIKSKFELFTDYWNPRIVAELNEQHVKLAKLKGEFVWHKHDGEDEMFFVITGSLTMELRDKIIEILPGEFIVIPKGVEHRPVAKEEVQVMLFEPNSTLNTGDQRNELTQHDLKRI